MGESTSVRAARRLIEAGFETARVAVLVDGLRGLYRAGYPMEGTRPEALDTDVTDTQRTNSWQSIDLLPSLRAGLSPHYTIEREIGAGGMAKVFLAQERHPPRKVAIKVLNPDLSTPNFRARFVREVELVSKLSHPNIVPIFAADECLFVAEGPDGLCYYVMPYLDGLSLRDRLHKNGNVPLDEAVSIIGQVAEGLSYAHAQGIIHRDIKPENILQSGEGRMLLTDFGIARAISAAGGKTLTAVGLPIGTPGYMSPEQLVGMRVLDARTDIYSLACVFYEMMVGHPPLLDSEARELVPALRAKAVSPWVARRLTRVLERALTPRPADRFARVDDSMAALRDAVRCRTIERWLPVIDRRVALIGAALLVVALAAASFVPWRRRPALDPRRAVVATFEDLSGDSGLASLAHLSAHWVTEALARGGVVEVVPFSTHAHLDAGDVRKLASRSGAMTVVLGSYYRDGDSVRFQMEFVDAQRGVVRRVLPPVAAHIRAPHQAAGPIRIAVAAAFDTLFSGNSAPR